MAVLGLMLTALDSWNVSADYVALHWISKYYDLLAKILHINFNGVYEHTVGLLKSSQR